MLLLSMPFGINSLFQLDLTRFVLQERVSVQCASNFEPTTSIGVSGMTKVLQHFVFINAETLLLFVDLVLVRVLPRANFGLQLFNYCTHLCCLGTTRGEYAA